MMHTRLVITKAEGAASLMRWGRLIAEAQGHPFEILIVSAHKTPSVEPVPLLHEGEAPPPDLLRAVRDAAWACWRPDTPEGEPPEGEQRVPEVSLRWLQHPDPVEGVLACLEDTHTLIVPCARAPKGHATGLDALPMALFQRATCAVMLLRSNPLDGAPSPEILVPLLEPRGDEDGPQAALRLGRALAATGGTLHVVNTLSEGVEDFEAVGRRIVEKAMAQAKAPMEGVQVVTEAGEDAWAGLARHLDAHIWLGEDGAAHNLMLVGAERWSTARRALLGVVPASRVSSAEGLSVAVIRPRRPLGARLRSQADRWLALTLPQMSREGRIELTTRLETGSAWGYDFMMLISLATAIAALGLIQGSGAVVIGAMLVAPLMTPLLGAGLALVQGNVRLVRSAIRAVMLGFATALLLGVLIGLLAPTRAMTGEILARGAPNILDLGVAFLSGIAAAFALSRPGLLAALPGVSIAAALVPPIATTGITLAWGHPEIAWRSALLFGTNVVAIVLGSAVALWLGGIRPREVGGKSWSGRAAAGLTVAMTVLAVVLTMMFFEGRTDSPTPPESPAHLAPEAEAALRADLERYEARLLDARLSGETLSVHVEAPAPLPPEVLRQLAQGARARQGAEVSLEVRTTLVTRID